MKFVAAAKLRRAQEGVFAARPYAKEILRVLRSAAARMESPAHDLLRRRPEEKILVMVLTGDRSLAGAFNSNTVRAAEVFAAAHSNIAYYTVGNKARNAVRRFGAGDRPAWPLAGPKLETAREVSAKASEDFIRGDISEIVLISSKMISMMSQRPQTRRLVPIERPPDDGSDAKAPQGAVEFAPSPEFVLSRLLPKYLEFTIYSAMLETDAGFFAAQLVAMSNATDNASKLIDELTIQMNNARQAAITKELLEIVAGAEALGVE